MRAGCIIAVLVAGCSFDVIGTNVGDPGGGTSVSPPQSIPSGADAGPPAAPSPPPTNPPPPPDMAVERVGTACASDADCDPGLVCAKTFGAGPGKIDIPGGYCTRSCATVACPANSICVTFSFGKYCSSSCPPDPCRTATGYVCCNEAEGQSACTPTGLCGDPKK